MGEEAGLPFLLEAVALAADVDDVGVVEQAVEDGACDHRVAAEDLAPGTEAFVAGQDDAATFVAARDHLEEQIALQLVQRQVADLVEDQQARVRVGLQLLLEPVLVEGPCQRGHQVVCAQEEHAPPGRRRLQAQSNAEHGLPCPGRADDQDVLPVLEEAQRGEVSHQTTVHRGLELEVELLEGLAVGKTGEAGEHVVTRVQHVPEAAGVGLEGVGGGEETWHGVAYPVFLLLDLVPEPGDLLTEPFVLAESKYMYSIHVT